MPIRAYKPKHMVPKKGLRPRSVALLFVAAVSVFGIGVARSDDGKAEASCDVLVAQANEALAYYDIAFAPTWNDNQKIHAARERGIAQQHLNRCTPTTTTSTTASTTTSTTAPTTTTTVAPTTTTTLPSSDFELSKAWVQTNTGPRVTPTKTRSGNFTSADAGKTFDGYVFSGGIFSNGVDNVKITNSIIRGPIRLGYGDSTGWVFEYVEVDGSTGPFNNQALIGNDGFTIYRSNIHHGSSLIRWQGVVNVTESWFHDAYEDTDGSHRSCIGTNGDTGPAESYFLRNYIDCTADLAGLSGAWVAYGDFGVVQNITVDGNYIAGSGSYTVYGGSCDGKPYPNGSGVKITNNIMVRAQYGFLGCSGVGSRGNTWTGNKDQNGNNV